MTKPLAVEIDFDYASKMWNANKKIRKWNL